SGWRDSFDAVMTFYVMEHVADPVATLRNIASLLKPAGILYCLIPNFTTNPADFIVADHVNHFTRRSIESTFRRAGFALREVDGESHEAAWVITASRLPDAASMADTLGRYTTHNQSADKLRRQVTELAHYWATIETRIRDFEVTHRDS